MTDVTLFNGKDIIIQLPNDTITLYAVSDIKYSTWSMYTNMVRVGANINTKHYYLSGIDDDTVAVIFEGSTKVHTFSRLVYLALLDSISLNIHGKV